MAPKTRRIGFCWALATLAVCFANAGAAEEEAKPAGKAATLPQAEDVADVPAQDLSAGGDEKKRYALIGLDPEQKAPKEGYGLLLVLPGGDGGIDFHPFVKRIHRHATPKDMLTVQLVSPAWTEEQSKNLVWPIERNTVKEARFTTEEYIIDVVQDVTERVKVDRRRVFTLTWSSSGPAGYAISLHPESPITGSFVAMSVFKPGDLPSLKAAKGRAYYILHSPEDFISIQMAETARDELTKRKAKVQFQTYAGGHGWRGDVYGMMRDGLKWLDENKAKPRKGS